MSVLHVDPDASTIYQSRDPGGSSGFSAVSTPYRSPLWPTTSAADTSIASTAATVGRGAIRMPTSMLDQASTPATSSSAIAASLDASLSPFDHSSALPALRGTQFIDTSSSATAAPLNLPQLMGQTRLVNAKMAQIRSELEAVVDKVWAVSGNNQGSGGHDGDADIPSVVLREPTCKGPLELTEALDKVGRLVGAVGHARRLLAQAIERPLSDFKAAQAAAINAQQHRGGATTAAMTTRSAMSMREQVAIGFGEEEIRLIKQELKKLLGHLTTVETRLLRVLGVGADDASHYANASTSDGLVIPMVATGHHHYVLRRRQEVDPAVVRRDVEQVMRCDPRFAQLVGVKGLSSSSFMVAGASAKVLTDQCGWSPKRLVYKSQFNYELEHVEELLAKEYAKQTAIAEGRDPHTAPGGHAASPSSGEPPAAVADNATEQEDGRTLVDTPTTPTRALANDATASVQEDCDADGSCAVPPPIGDDAMSDLADAVGSLSPMAASFAPTPASEVDVGAAEQGMSTGTVQHEPDGVHGGGDRNGNAPDPAEAVEPEAPPPMPQAVNFPTRVRAWVREFLLSGACQWVACEDEATKATFFFNLTTGEKVDNLEEYYADVVAEAIARDLLAEGEHNDVGWILVPSGASGYDDNDSDYYCHQLSGEVTWNLVEWVKEH